MISRPMGVDQADHPADWPGLPLEPFLQQLFGTGMVETSERFSDSQGGTARRTANCSDTLAIDFRSESSWDHESVDERPS